MPLLSSDADTIAAIGTPRGEGGIGIVRISGPLALPIAQRLFRPSRRKAYRPTRTHTLTHGHIRSPETGVTVDEALIAYFRAPRTYTGEEMIEIHAHGGPLVLRTILRLVCDQGARLANPGEFTQRAFLNGRLDLAQAEAVADTIAAKTEWSLRAAASQLEGSLSREVEAIRQRLIAALAEIEARIDFPDEDLDFEPSESLLVALNDACTRIRRLAEDAQRGKLLRDGLNLVIIGKPNVGKSSLLNALLREDRAIVTEIPGTTRDVIEDTLNLGGVPVRLSDTAGIRETADPIEKEGVARSHKRAEAADLLLVVLDTSRPLDTEDFALLDRVSGRPALAVLNKSDLPSVWSRERIVSRMPCVVLSLKTGEGLDRLIETITAQVLGSEGLGAEPPLVTNLRHQQALEQANDALDHALGSLAEERPPELVAVDLRGSLHALGLIVGETTTDDILDRIFSQFCIGK